MFFQAFEDHHLIPREHERHCSLRRLFIGALLHQKPSQTGLRLTPALFGILFSLLLRYAFSRTEEDIYIHTRSNGNLFNLSRLRAKSKVRKVLIREMLFANDIALTSHTETGLRDLIRRFSDACKEFGITISIKKTKILGQAQFGTMHLYW